MKIKKILISTALFPLAFLVGCQSYPKNPSTPSVFDSKVEVNKTIPTELDGVSYELVKYPEKPTKNKKTSVK